MFARLAGTAACAAAGIGLLAAPSASAAQLPVDPPKFGPTVGHACDALGTALETVNGLGGHTVPPQDPGWCFRPGSTPLDDPEHLLPL